jgi:hypothetical protein
MGNVGCGGNAEYCILAAASLTIIFGREELRLFFGRLSMVARVAGNSSDMILTVSHADRIQGDTARLALDAVACHAAGIGTAPAGGLM